MKKKNDALRGNLLCFAQDIADTSGADSINIRTLAAKAGVATGTVYNYFSGKDEILYALTERYWHKALEELEGAVTAESFVDQLDQIFHSLRDRVERSAGKMMTSLRNMETAGQARMAAMQNVLEEALIRRMEADPAVRSEIWSDRFTKREYARFLMREMMALLRGRDEGIVFLLEIVRRTLY